MQPPPIAALYLKTEVLVEENGEFAPIQQSRLRASGPVHIITAWNPGDQRPTDQANRAANQELFEQLVTRGLEPVRAVGQDPDSSHAEESWAVSGAADDIARELGAQFGQVAVFRITTGSQTVLACEEGWQASRSIPLGESEQ
jgi:hypothetical protein